MIIINKMNLLYKKRIIYFQIKSKINMKIILIKKIILHWEFKARFSQNLQEVMKKKYFQIFFKCKLMKILKDKYHSWKCQISFTNQVRMKIIS